MQKKLSFIFVFALIFCLTAIAQGQVTGGAITGSVVDPNGAVIPNATVTVTDKARGRNFTAQTTSAGSYLFPNIPVGEYTIAIEATGFSRITRDVNVSLNQTSTVDFTLQVGVGSTVVDVVGTDGAVIQTDTSQLGKSFDIRKAQDLPVGGDGNVNNLATLAPNVIPPANGTAGSGGVSGGIRARGNSFNVDGVDNNDPSVTGPTTQPIQDAVEEFTLLQNNFSAEFGAGAGGQFNIITRSGTNQYRGSLFTYIGSERFNARSTDEDGTEKNFFKEVRYGGTFGGPLPFFNFGEGGPMFTSGKNKLFFFGAYERYFQTGAGSMGSYFAPTAQGLNQIAAIPGVSPFVVNLLRNSLTLAPAPNAAATAQYGTVLGVPGIQFGQVILPIPTAIGSRAYQFNIDHLPNQKDQFRYRYNRYRYLSEQAGSGGLQFNNNLLYNTDLFSFNWIRSITSNIVNDLRLSYRGVTDDRPLINPEFANFPNITVNSLNLAIGPNVNLPQGDKDNSYQIYDSLTLIKGQHTFKFGVDYRRSLITSDFLPRSRGDYTYSTFDLLLQDLRPDVVNIRGVGSGAFTSNNHRIFAFGQDDWKVRPNLTLNLGLRYEFQGNYRDIALQTTASPANVPGVVEFNNPEADKNNFAPRLGLAWSPSWDNWIGRALFGSQGESSIRVNFSRAFFSNFSNLALISLPPTLQGEVNGGGSATNFFANGASSGSFTPSTNPATLRALAGSLILDQIVPYSDSFAVSYQRQLDSNTGLELRYLKTYGRKLPVQVQLNARQVPNSAFVVPTFLNQPTTAQLAGLPTIQDIAAANPGILQTTFLGTRPLAQYGFGGALTGFPSVGESEYDGVSASLTRRFARNFGFTAAYTFSRTIDNSTNELNTSALNPRRAQDAGNYFSPDGRLLGEAGLNLDNERGRSPLDIPHRFVTSFNVDVPFFNNSDNAFLKAVLGGFQINGIFQIQSGQPITVLAGRDANRNGDAAGDRAIFNPNGDPRISSGITAVGLVNGVVTTVPLTVGGNPNPAIRAYVATNPNAGYISTGFFARELANQGAGTAPRNSLRTDGFNRTDLVVLKNTRFGTDGRFNFQIGAEIYDLFNQRVRTLGLTATTGVGAQSSAFATAGNNNFLNYNIGTFPGRTITMRAKFLF
jgi:hypothetical protein